MMEQEDISVHLYRKFIIDLFPDYHEKIIKLLLTISYEYNGFFYKLSTVNENQFKRVNKVVKRLYEQQVIIFKLTRGNTCVK